MSAAKTSGWEASLAKDLSIDDVQGIVTAAADIALIIDANGVIASVMLNTVDDSFGNLEHWAGRPVVEFLTEESVSKFTEAHAAFLAGNAPRKQIELNHQDNASWEFPVRYSLQGLGKTDYVLMLGRDLRPIAETQQQLVQAQIALEKGYEARREFDARYRVLLNNTRDAIVFASVRDGRVKDMNEPAAALLGIGRETLAHGGIGLDGEHAQQRPDRIPASECLHRGWGRGCFAGNADRSP